MLVRLQTTRSPASAFEKRTYGAENIEPSRYSDFFNKSSSLQTYVGIALRL
jgi:hypothetical protein